MMKPIFALIISGVLLAGSVNVALASHAPNCRNWQAIVTGDETVDTKCKQYGFNGSCVQ
jgi:hypothetical protein